MTWRMFLNLPCEHDAPLRVRVATVVAILLMSSVAVFAVVAVMALGFLVCAGYFGEGLTAVALWLLFAGFVGVLLWTAWTLSEYERDQLGTSRDE